MGGTGDGPGDVGRDGPRVGPGRHNQLASGFDPIWHRWLVTTNLVRTVAWTVHAVILLYATYRQLD